MTKVLSLAPPRLGGLDMLLPIFIEMKMYCDVSIELTIDDKSLLDQLNRDPFLSKKIADVVDKMTILPKKEIRSGPNIITKICSLFVFLKNIIGITIRLIFSKNPIFMHAGSTDTLLIGFIARIIKLKRGYTIGHFKLMDRLFTEDKSVTGLNSAKFGDFFICFNKRDVCSWKKEHQNKTIEIGYPRLYKSWLDVLNSSSKKYLKNDVDINLKKNNSALIVIFLPSTVKNVFEESELKEWILEVTSCVNKVFKEALIVLKPHPMQNITIVKDVLTKIKNMNIVISYIHPGLMASQANLVISHHSSTIIDALALDKPVIQHHKFTEHWLKRHPEGSSLLDLGQFWTQDKTELMDKLKIIKKNQWIKPEFRHNIGHKDNLKLFFKKISLESAFKE